MEGHHQGGRGWPYFITSHICLSQEKTPQLTWSTTPELWCREGCFVKSLDNSLTFVWPCLHGLGCVHTIPVQTVQMGRSGSDSPKATAMKP